MKFRSHLLAALACAATASPAVGQTFTWNNTGSNWTTAGSWNPVGGPPTGNAIAQFNVENTYGTVAINQPTWAASPAAYGTLSLAPPQFTGWTFDSAGTLEQIILRAYGPVTHSFTGPSVRGGANTLPILIHHGSTVTFSGTGVATTNILETNLHGGTLRLDNGSTNNANRLSDTAPVRTFGGGAIDFVGNAGGSTETIGALTVSSGYTRVNVEHHSTSAPTVLTLGGLTRNSTGTVNFASTGPTGQLGAAGNNPRIMITGQAAGFIAPWVTANGAEFAVYDTTNGVRAAVSGAGGDYAQTYTTAITTNLGEGQFGALDQAAGTPNVTWSGSAGAGNGSHLRIKPGATGQSLTFAVSSGNNVNLNSIVLAGSQDYTVTRDTSNGNTNMRLTGNGLGSRNIGVLDANATLTFNVPIGGAGFDVAKFGDGILDLTANMSGTDFIGSSALNTRMYINGGVLRVKVGAGASLVAGSGQSVFFRGGVLEITGGENGNGTSADFTRVLGISTGTVNWSSSTTNRGSGGFSAFGSTASVNIGGVSTPLTWNVGNFVQDGDALKFGSTRSNATLTWHNPIALDGLTPGNYFLREINVTRGVGNAADKTIISNTISGSTTADLIKTGTGVLELTAQNTYQGNTLIHGGTLVLGGSGSTLGFGSLLTGNVVVGKGATLAGVGSISPDTGKSVIVNPGGAIRGGNPTVNVDRLGTLTVNADVTIHSTAADNGVLRVEASRTGTGTAANSKIAVTGVQVFHLNPGIGNKFTIELVSGANSLQAGETYTLTLATVVAAGNLHLNGSSLAANTTIAATNYTLQSSAFSFSNASLATDVTGKNLDLTFTVTPVPEPTTVLGLATTGLIVLARLRRTRVTS